MKFKQTGSLVAAAFLFTACASPISTKNPGFKTHNPDIGGGQILFYTTDGEFLSAANVGNLPDMVIFSPDGKTVLSANEGEPSDDYRNDPKGSVSIITLGDPDENLIQDVTTLFFDDVIIPLDLRIKPGSTPAQDIEPEYIAINEAGTKAWVSLQENNGLAVIDLNSKTITSVVSLGKKAFTFIDINTKDGANVAAAPDNVYGLYQPDTIVSYRVDGKDYVVTANEGDDREYGAWEDYEKAVVLHKNGEAFSRQLTEDIIEVKGRKKVRVLKDLGKDKNGTYTSLYLAGTRSFSIWDAEGKQVYDSGSEFEQKLAAQYPDTFNTRVDDTDDKMDIAELAHTFVPHDMIGDTAYFWQGVDARSHKKGCEPEALAIAKIGSNIFAYIGLEKQGGFFVYDISNPGKAIFVEYNNDINYGNVPSDSGDLAPEGMVHFEQDKSHYLAIANELSSTVSIYKLRENGSAGKLASLKVGSFDSGAAEIIAYDSAGKKLYVTNGETKNVDIIDVSTPASPVKSGSINFLEHADKLQSVAVGNGLVAIAVSRR